MDFENLIALPVLLFSIVFHEYAHAWTAFKAGDDTAALMGRLSFNPIVHIDPIGSVAFPLLQFALTGNVYLGWAKPVPVNPLRFKTSNWDILVSLAGPGANLLLAFVATVVLKIAFLTGLMESQSAYVFFLILVQFIALNIVLCLFNLIPVPPLDGSHVLYQLLKRARSPLADSYLAISKFGFMILLLILLSPVGNYFFAFTRGIFGAVINFAVS